MKTYSSRRIRCTKGVCVCVCNKSAQLIMHQGVFGREFVACMPPTQYGTRAWVLYLLPFALAPAQPSVSGNRNAINSS